MNEGRGKSVNSDLSVSPAWTHTQIESARRLESKNALQERRTFGAYYHLCLSCDWIASVLQRIPVEKGGHPRVQPVCSECH